MIHLTKDYPELDEQVDKLVQAMVKNHGHDKGLTKARKFLEHLAYEHYQTVLGKKQTTTLEDIGVGV